MSLAMRQHPDITSMTNQCPYCHRNLQVRKAKTGANQGRLLLVCYNNHGCSYLYVFSDAERLAAEAAGWVFPGNPPPKSRKKKPRPIQATTQNDSFPSDSPSQSQISTHPAQTSSISRSSTTKSVPRPREKCPRCPKGSQNQLCSFKICLDCCLASSVTCQLSAHAKRASATASSALIPSSSSLSKSAWPRSTISASSSTLVENSSEDEEDRALVLGHSRNTQQVQPSFSEPSTSWPSLSLAQIDLILEQFSDSEHDRQQQSASAKKQSREDTYQASLIARTKAAKTSQQRQEKRPRLSDKKPVGPADIELDDDGKIMPFKCQRRSEPVPQPSSQSSSSIVALIEKSSQFSVDDRLIPLLGGSEIGYCQILPNVAKSGTFCKPRENSAELDHIMQMNETISCMKGQFVATSIEVKSSSNQLGALLRRSGCSLRSLVLDTYEIPRGDSVKVLLDIKSLESLTLECAKDEFDKLLDELSQNPSLLPDLKQLKITDEWESSPAKIDALKMLRRELVKVEITHVE
ncbi:hypothetical protein C8J56DRAFT_1031400 [Mycena floridula]|nr:hypothetical protein C8J56DRAFT_1031400 [Mycena floridula]